MVETEPTISFGTLTLEILKVLNLLPLGGIVPSRAYIVRLIMSAWFLKSKIQLYIKAYASKAELARSR